MTTLTNPVAVSAPEQLILVDENDVCVGTMEKLAAHEGGGVLHRAFSVFIFDEQGRILLQQRAAGKYHFGGLWTNACCSHPRPGEEVSAAARRRLHEEFGFETSLEKSFSFLYRAHDEDSGLSEWEYDHVFIGRWRGFPQPNPEEIADWKWLSPEELRADLAANPERYTPWFRLALAPVLDNIESMPSGVTPSGTPAELRLQ